MTDMTASQAAAQGATVTPVSTQFGNDVGAGRDRKQDTDPRRVANYKAG